MKKILLAGVLGGLVMFVWGAVSHMLLPLGNMGLSAMPDEATVVSTMKASIPESGLYLFPYEDMSSMSSDEQEAATKRLTEKYEQGPSGFLVFRAGGRSVMHGGTLAAEFGSNVLCALIAALLLALAAPSLAGYGMRVWFVGLLGFFSVLSLEFSYWNWYGFPTAYTIAQFIIEVVGWTLVGLVLAAIVKRPAAA